MCALSFEVFTTPERLRALERLEQAARRLRVPQHALINELKAQASEEELVASCARRWLIGCGSASRPGGALLRPRIWAPRRALKRPTSNRSWTNTAKAQRDGLIGDGYIKIIRWFFAHLPAEVDVLTRDAAEADLAGKPPGCGPDQLAK